MFTSSVLVLSPGRTGSVLLAQNLSRCLGYPGQVAYIQDHDLSPAQSDAVLHSHLLFERQEIKHLTPVFSVRKNLIEALMSNYLASINNLYHSPVSEPPPTVAAIEFNTAWMETIIEIQQQWFEFYSQQLTDASLVVIYETMIDHLYPPTVQYRAIYPCKSELIVEYDQAVDWLHRRIPESMLVAHRQFIDFEIRPSRGLYHWAAGLRH